MYQNRKADLNSIILRVIIGVKKRVAASADAERFASMKQQQQSPQRSDSVTAA